MAKISSATKAASFEAIVSELESLVGQMEGGDLSLEASLAAYTRGVNLLKAAQAELEAAEAKIKVLDGEVLKTLKLDQL